MKNQFHKVRLEPRDAKGRGVKVFLDGKEVVGLRDFGLSIDRPSGLAVLSVEIICEIEQ